MKLGPGFASMRRQETGKISNEDYVCCHIEKRKTKRKGRELLPLCKIKENRGRRAGMLVKRLKKPGLLSYLFHALSLHLAVATSCIRRGGEYTHLG